MTGYWKKKKNPILIGWVENFLYLLLVFQKVKKENFRRRRLSVELIYELQTHQQIF